MTMKNEFGSWKQSFRRTFGKSREGKSPDELHDAKENKQQEEVLNGPQTLAPDTGDTGRRERTEASFPPPGSEEEQNENTRVGSTRSTLVKTDCEETQAIDGSEKKPQRLQSDFEAFNLPRCSSSPDRPCSTSEPSGYSDHPEHTGSSQQQRENLSFFRTAVDARSSMRGALDFVISVGSVNRFVPNALPRLRLPPLIASLEIFQARSEAADTSVETRMSEHSPTFSDFHTPPRTISELDQVCVSSMTPAERKMYHGSLREWRSDLSIASQYRCGARTGGSVASRSITDGSTVRSVRSDDASIPEYDQASAFQDMLQQRMDELHDTQDVGDDVEHGVNAPRGRQKHRCRERWATWTGIARIRFASLCRRQRHEIDPSLPPSVPYSTEGRIGADSDDIQWSQQVDASQPALPESHIPMQGEFYPSTVSVPKPWIGQSACDTGDTDHQSDEEAAPVPPLRVTSKRPRTAAEKKERLQKLKERLAGVPQPGTNVAEEGHANRKQLRERDSGEQAQDQEQETISPRITASSSLEQLLVWTELIRKGEAANSIVVEPKAETSLSSSMGASSHPPISSGGEQTSIVSPLGIHVASDKAQRPRSLQPVQWPSSPLQNTRLQAPLHKGQEELKHVQSVAAAVRRDNNDLPMTQSKHGKVSTTFTKHHDKMMIPDSLTSSISQAVDFDSDPRLEDVQNRTRIMGLVHQDWLREAAQQRMTQAPRQTDALSPLSGTIHFLGTSDAQVGRDGSQPSNRFLQ